MGGRTFECLDAVILRYKTEQIVEGHTLGSHVKKQSCEDDGSYPTRQEEPEESAAEKIYASLRECREQANPQKAKGVKMQGFLQKKKEKLDRWQGSSQDGRSFCNYLFSGGNLSTLCSRSRVRRATCTSTIIQSAQSLKVWSTCPAPTCTACMSPSLTSGQCSNWWSGHCHAWQPPHTWLLRALANWKIGAAPSRRSVSLRWSDLLKWQSCGRSEPCTSPSLKHTGCPSSLFQTRIASSASTMYGWLKPKSKLVQTRCTMRNLSWTTSHLMWLRWLWRCGTRVRGAKTLRWRSSLLSWLACVIVLRWECACGAESESFIKSISPLIQVEDWHQLSGVTPIGEWGSLR